MGRLLCPFVVFLLGIGGFSAVQAQSVLTCNAGATPVQVHGEGITERVADLVMTCSGGVAGARVTGNLNIFLNVNVTNRVASTSSGTVTDIVLTADNGSGPQPIATPGVVVGPGSLVFNGVSFTLSATGTVTLRLANLRAAANQLMFASGSSIQAIFGVDIAGVQAAPSGPLRVGLPQHGLYASLSGRIICGPQGSPLPANTGSFASFLASGAAFSSTRLTEGFADSFGTRGAPVNLNADSGTRIMVNYSGLPPGARLFVPDVIAGSDAVQPTAGGDLGLPASGGQYAPGGNGSLLLSLVQYADASGAHGSPLYAPGLPGSGTVSFNLMSEVVLNGGAGSVVYEVVDANPSTQESAQFPTFLSLAPFSGNAVETSETVSMAPVSTVETATVGDPILRFQQVPVPPDCSLVGDCSAAYFPRLLILEPGLNYSAAAGSSYQVDYIHVENVSGGVMPWTATITYQNGTGWLRLFPDSGVNSRTVRVDALPGNLAPGTYQAILTIDAGPIAGSRDVPITLVITPASAIPLPVVQSVVNAATFLAGPVAPASIAAVWGSKLSGHSVTVTFAGIPGQILGGNDTQINVVVPAALTGQTSAQVVVNVDGNSSAPVTVSLAEFAPGIFTNGVLNQDYSINGPQHPAALGSILQIFATGLAGQGLIRAKIGDRVVTRPYYAGPAPGLPGVQQVDLIVPTDLAGATADVAVCGATPQQVVCSPAVAVTLASP